MFFVWFCWVGPCSFFLARIFSVTLFNSINLTCASRHTQRLHPCKKIVHCTSLCEIRLPYTLHTIRVKAFMNCAALPELRYRSHYATSPVGPFWTAPHSGSQTLGHKWRGTYAEENAFAVCPAMRWPLWLRMIPDIGYWGGPLWRPWNPAFLALGFGAVNGQDCTPGLARDVYAENCAGWVGGWVLCSVGDLLSTVA